ncbi:hypothetical protein GCM10009109_09520 [Marinobacterium sediminicola]
MVRSQGIVEGRDDQVDQQAAQAYARQEPEAAAQYRGQSEARRQPERHYLLMKTGWQE